MQDRIPAPENVKPHLKKNLFLPLLLILTLLFTSCNVSTKALVQMPEESASTAAEQNTAAKQTEVATTKAAVSSARTTWALEVQTTGSGKEEAEGSKETAVESSLEDQAASQESSKSQTKEKKEEEQKTSASSKESSGKKSSEKQTTQAEKQNKGSYDYILNTRSKKIHRPTCGSVDQMKEKNKWYFQGTCQEAMDMGYTPCKNCNPDAGLKEKESKKSEEGNRNKSKDEEETKAPKKEEKTHDYVLNKNTKKFHYTWCRSVKQMKDSNKKYFTGTRQEVIDKGYSPCGNCNP